MGSKTLISRIVPINSTIRTKTSKNEEDSKIYLLHAYLPWADLLIGAWKEAKDSAQFLIEGFWEGSSPLEATALLYELYMAAKGTKLHYHPGQRALDQFHYDLTVTLTAFYCLTVPVSEWSWGEEG